MSELKNRIRALQIWLGSRGFDPGPTDGDYGPKTKAALNAFLSDDRKLINGVPWLDEAKRLINTREIAGAENNPLIMGWGKRLKLWYPNDEVAWCGLFVAHCIESQMPTESIPENPLGARKWADFGVPCEPQVGAVLVFWRGSKAGWKGHVGFYHAEDTSAYHVLGGNQSNAVNVKRISKDRLLASRWPATAELPRGITQTADASGRLSINEA